MCALSFLQVFFNGGSPLVLLDGYQGQGRALVVAAGCSTNPVYVGVGVVREVKVDDVGDELENYETGFKMKCSVVNLFSTFLHYHLFWFPYYTTEI